MIEVGEDREGTRKSNLQYLRRDYRVAQGAKFAQQKSCSREPARKYCQKIEVEKIRDKL